MFSPRYARSRALFDRAQRCLPGGNTRITVYTKPHPIYLERGEGATVTDVDGNTYVDFVNNFSSLIHGHAHPDVTVAASDAVRRGSALGAPTVSEVALAELLCQRYPAIEAVRYTNSGTEAVMLAIRAARAATGRSMIAKIEGAYHGSYEYAEVSLNPTRKSRGDAARPNSVAYGPGVPESVPDSVVVLPFNDPHACVDVLKAHRSELAAVLLDVIPSRIGMVAARPEYLAAVEEECRRSGTLVILDEVISLRLAYGGAHAERGLEPDLVCMGKIIGGGFPIGGVGGRSSVMEVFNQLAGTPLVAHTGTYNANPVSMAAGLTSLQLLTVAALEDLRVLGRQLREGLRQSIIRLGLPWQVTGEGSLFRIHPMDRELVDYRSTRLTSEEERELHALYWGLLDRGVRVTPGCYGYLSTAMRAEHVEALNVAFEAVAGTLDVTRDSAVSL